jgi:PKD repeat protein
VFSGVGLFSVTLVASNGTGSSTVTKTNYISTTFAPATVDFTAFPTSGVRPLTVQFTDTSTGAPTAWAWDFDNNGTVDSTIKNPSYVYTVAGTYTVKLTATNAGGPASKTIANMITVSVGTCTVPNFANTSSSAAQATWNAAGFTTTVNFQQGNLPWTINSQTQVVGLSIPCNSLITVSKN